MARHLDKLETIGRRSGRERIVHVTQHGGILLWAHQAKYILGRGAILHSAGDSGAVGQRHELLYFANLQQTRLTKTQGLGATSSRTNPTRDYGGYGGEGRGENARKRQQ